MIAEIVYITKENPEIVHYQFCPLVFGRSPAILSTVIEHHLQGQAEELQQIVSVLDDWFYVDDLICGAWDDSGANEIYEKADEIMESGGFKLRKWTSNLKTFRDRVALDKTPNPEESNDVQIFEPETIQVSDSDGRPLSKLEGIAKHDPTTDQLELEVTDNFADKLSKNGDENEENSVKIRDVSLKVDSDEFEYDLSTLVEYAKTLPRTKRSVLKMSAKVFDPLGFLSPITILLKTFFQHLCIDNVDWDDPLTGEDLKSWEGIVNDLRTLHPIRISRCYFAISNDPLMFELHGFCDASCKAYAAVE